MVHVFGYANEDDDEGEMKLKVDIPPYLHRELVQVQPTTIMTRPIGMELLDEERVEHYKALLWGPKALRPILFFVRVREDFYLLDGHHKWAALKSFRDKDGGLTPRGGFIVDTRNYPALRMPLVLELSLLPDHLPPRHRNHESANGPYSKIVDPQRHLSERELSVFDGVVPMEKREQWKVRLKSSFNQCLSTLYSPITLTGQVVRLRVSNLDRRVADVFWAFEAVCEVISVSPITECTQPLLDNHNSHTTPETTPTREQRLAELIAEVESGSADPSKFRCTLEVTADVSMTQQLVYCFSCMASGICVACAKKYHKGHELTTDGWGDNPKFCRCYRNYCTFLSHEESNDIMARQREADRKEFEGCCIVEIDACFLDDVMTVLPGRELNLYAIRTNRRDWLYAEESSFLCPKIEVTLLDNM